MAEVASVWTKVSTASGLPASFDIPGLTVFVDDAVQKRLPLVQEALKESDKCN